MLFCDLVGSTERQSRLGDDAADEFRRGFFAALSGAVASTHGEIVKNTGDGLMVVFATSAVDAVTCASLMHDEVEQLAGHDPAFVRVGISAGEVAREGDDWFGTPVNEAARLCATAEAGQTLVSDLVRGLVGSRGGHQFRSVGALALKGLPSPLPAAAVVRTPIAAPPSAPATPRSRRRGPVIAAGAVVVLVALAGAFALVQLTDDDDADATVPAAEGYTPRVRTARCPAAFRDQVPNGTCGELSVPEDRTDPGGRWLRLRFTRAPARSGAGAADPVVDMNPSDTFSLQEDVAKSPSRDHADLISIATRLVETPDPSMSCPDFAPIGREVLGTAPGDPSVVARGQMALRKCHDRYVAEHVAVDRYTLLDAADDVLDLLRVLHIDHVNLVAGSDNAISAYAIERKAPGAVRTLTMESPVAPGTSPWSDPTGELTHAFDAYAILCRADPSCSRAFPDLSARQYSNWVRSNAEPQRVPVGLRDGSSVPVHLDGDRVTKAIANTLGANPENGLIAAAIYAPQQVEVIAATEGGLWDYPLAIPAYPWVRSLGAWCSYDAHTRAPGASISSDARPSLAGVDDGILQWECAAWRVPKLADDAFVSVANDIPTLIVDGALATVASHQWTLTLQGGLTKATTLSFPTLGADLLKKGIPPCLNDLRRRFLADPSRNYDAAAKACEKQSPPVTFATSAP